MMSSAGHARNTPLNAPGFIGTCEIAVDIGIIAVGRIGARIEFARGHKVSDHRRGNVWAPGTEQTSEGRDK